MEPYDVVIVGGAMSGATLALALDQASQQQLKIAVVESYQINDHAHPGFDARSIALSLGTVNLLKQWHLWSLIADHGTAIKHIHVSDQGHAGMTEFTASDYHLPAMGYVVELAEVGKRFNQALRQNDNITLYCPYQLENLDQTSDSVLISLKDGQEGEIIQLSAKLLVAADGADSNSCQAIGLEQKIESFSQFGLIANVQTSQPHQGQAFERFTRYGPIALLPMSNKRSSLVWCMPEHEAKRLSQLPEQAFCSELQAAFGWRLGRIEKSGERSIYPLTLRYREQIISHRFAAVGNAAQTLHPIAGQGFNLGIRDVASLVDTIVENLQDVGGYTPLIQYQQRRAQDRQQTIAMTSGLVHLFSNPFFPLLVSRNIGLGIMDNLPQLKRPLFQRALGNVDR
ncbi:2-octaprenyl-6-methoxyphenyl hydroxylase [Vibrio hippocampi]|uniref:2-octaprenyl-6-methoxyphenol hydroxylase n=1 Tax=Vibrio hippocampi TaxID=654686 RepID=A0ABN8DE11_9VIBR|nr:2-octaprenyl-6-methoxyphenyl hydroxylase [Vibrio hippocampi]CAH0524641.1 2-octaprenyl-6-methoxyphenol hydroxylase [Vibrio hippocampi]